MTTKTRIQGVGMVDTKSASDLQRGDVTMWNCGGFYTVASVTRISKRYLMVELVDWETGNTWSRKMRDDRAQAVTETAGRGSVGKAWSYDVASRLPYFKAALAGVCPV